MKQRSLGNTEIKASEIGFGCMSLQLADVASDKRLLLDALEAGINFFDTADLYNHGENEKLLGNAFEANRSKVVIATKVGNQWRNDRSGWDWNPRKSYILKAAELSLKRLRTDYIDIYQLHGGTLEDPIDETVEAFEILQKQGKIRYYGISSIRPTVIKRWIERSSLSTCMMQYSLLDRRPEEQALKLLENANIGLLARGTLAKGTLLNQKEQSFLEYSKQEIDYIRNQLPSDFQDRFNTVVSFPIRLNSSSISVVGIRNKEQLTTAAGFNFTAVPEKMTRILKPQQYELHRI